MNKIHALIHRLHSHNVGVLLVRLAVGIVFIHAGWLKLQAIDMVVAGFAAGGIPAWLAYFVSYAEFICGILLIVGIFVRYAGIILSIIMIVAALKVHLVNGYGMQNNGVEYVLLLLMCSLALVTFGAGRFSLAACLRKYNQKKAQVVQTAQI